MGGFFFYSVQSLCNIVKVMLQGCQECAAAVKQKEGDVDSAGCVWNLIPRSSKRRGQEKCLKPRLVPTKHFKKEEREKK